MLLSLLPTRPREFLDHARAELQIKAEQVLRIKQGQYDPREWPEIVMSLEECLGSHMRPYLLESGARRMEMEVRRLTANNASELPFSLDYNADLSLAYLCYAICRAVRPAIVLETGVGYGVTTTFILQALHKNGHGCLYSVDLPPLGLDTNRFVGYLVPDSLRDRWTLQRGDSKRVLVSLLTSLRKVDVFLHDSLHTFARMDWELRTVSPFLGAPGVVLADDVQGNSAFEGWVNSYGPAWSATMREIEKRALCGVAVTRCRAQPDRAPN